MLILIIFYLHVVGSVFAFTARWQEEGSSEGFMILGFIGLVFVIGWCIAGMIVHFVIPAGIPKVLDSNQLSLLMLTLGEAALYYFYFLKDKKEQPAN